MNELAVLEQDIVDVQVHASDISEEDIEKQHKPLIKRAVGSVVGLVRKYVPEAVSSVKNYFLKDIVYDLERHPDQPHTGGWFIPATKKLVANTYMIGRNSLFYIESLYHEGRHALRHALGSMDRLYNGFVKEVGEFWASMLYPMYEEGATSRLTQMELGKTRDGYAPYRAGAEQVERDWGVRKLIYNTEDDARKVLPSFLKGMNNWFTRNRAYIAA